MQSLEMQAGAAPGAEMAGSAAGASRKNPLRPVCLGQHLAGLVTSRATSVSWTASGRSGAVRLCCATTLVKRVYISFFG